MSLAPHQQLLRKLPSVDEILLKPEISGLLLTHSRTVVVEAIRSTLQGLREKILSREDLSGFEESLLSFDHLYPNIELEVDLQTKPRLRRVINATGVIIHTNLGRSPLHPSALDHLAEIARAYSNLEYDLGAGRRGSRHSHVERILCRLTGAESAIVVNNNAGAVLLALNTMAEGREVIISRGELVEIGGAFRIPDVMKRSGAFLREVGTTNRTYLSDYQKAIHSQTALLLKVHTSNFRVMGFASEVSLDELVRLGKEVGLPVVEDLGSGCFVDLSRYGLEKEPTVQEAVQTGVDLVTFSGDKLLGGPQAGLIVGKKKTIDLIKINPLTRALRIDKLTLAALEATLLLYLDEKRAVEEIPALRMLTLSQETLEKRGKRLLRKLNETAREAARVMLKKDVSQVGGGALPLQELPTMVLGIKPHDTPVEDLERDLRRGAPPILARISKDELILDMRTVFDEEIPLLVRGLEKALKLKRPST